MTRAAIESLESRQLLAADLSVAITSTNLTDSLTAGVKKVPSFTAAVQVSVADGTVDKKTKGNVTVTLALHPSSGSDVTLGTAKIAASKFAKGPVTSTFKFKQPATLAAGTNYTLRAALNTGTVIADANTANNTAAGKSVSVASSSTGGTTTGVLSSLGLGNALTFKKTGGTTTGNGFGNETGTFKDNAGHTGTYSLILGTGALLTLKDAAGATIGFGQTTVVANTNSGTPKIGGKTLTFGVPQAGSTGYAQFGGIDGKVYYK